MANYNLKVNGKVYNVNSDDDVPLLWVLRDELNLVGTKYGCGIGLCGTCTVHINGIATRSCLLPASRLEGSEITTIEGLETDKLHPVQEAWKELDVPQCGYCQTGQIMTATSFLKQNPNPNKDEIRNAMNGNLCRCASYNRIEKAVALAAKKMS
ncbi:(2Fe-2S)-binding protein [Winogradskyella alexanderae]|uniref:(2Fe-2S)-binding protein n=1 Tax=Winogradskyella alexanderae TaxID=2877123 RepID=A0ABS7XP96_9FLAO|nr:(2Fe-2S)-binding protein [Winogradskyella alexanderae]MCA0131837.1 (2Fe-2S)-binding protein [Winogradskyella alexanderae]